MSSTRKFARTDQKRKVELQRLVSEVITLDALLFGTVEAPTDEFLDQRRELIGRWRALMTEYGSKQPAKLRDYLYKAYETYDVDKDGPSKAMTLIWDIETLKELEAEHGAPKADQGFQYAVVPDGAHDAEEDGVQRRADDEPMGAAADSALREGQKETP